MKDIVERLRRAEALGLLDGRLMIEAADEIERLRGDRAQLVLMTEQLRTANQEIERLRAGAEDTAWEDRCGLGPIREA